MSAIEQNHLLLAQVLKDYQIVPGQVARAMTSCDRVRDQRALENSRKYFRKHFPTIGEEMIENFLHLKQSSKPIIEIFGAFSELVVLNESQIKTIFSSGRRPSGDRKDGWQQFRELYPKSKGTLEVSLPAYSADGTDCLIEIGQQFDWLAGSGAACHYRLRDGQWTSTAQVGTWIS